MTTIWQFLSPIIFWCANNLIVVYLTLWLTNYRENRRDKVRFSNRINCVHRELQMNFCNRGSPENPFFIECLKNLIHEELTIYYDPILFDKAHECLCTAQILNSPSHSGLIIRDGQNLMRILHEYISDTYKNTLVGTEPKEKFFIRVKTFILKFVKLPRKTQKSERVI